MRTSGVNALLSIKMSRIIIFIFALLLTACSNTTTEKEKYEDGKLKAEKIFTQVDGEKQLIKEIHYHPNGEKYMEGSYKNNKREGHWTSWYDNGQLWSEGDFSSGLSEGKWVVHHKNGQIYYEGTFKNGERTGLWKFYDESGKLINEVDYSKKQNP